MLGRLTPHVVFSVTLLRPASAVCAAETPSPCCALLDRTANLTVDSTANGQPGRIVVFARLIRKPLLNRSVLGKK